MKGNSFSLPIRISFILWRFPFTFLRTREPSQLRSLKYLFYVRFFNEVWHLPNPEKVDRDSLMMAMTVSVLIIHWPLINVIINSNPYTLNFQRKSIDWRSSDFPKYPTPANKHHRENEIPLPINANELRISANENVFFQTMLARYRYSRWNHTQPIIDSTESDWLYTHFVQSRF